MSASLTQDRVEWHLWNWEQWMQHSKRDGAYATHASGGIECYRSNDGWREYEEGDRVAAACVQAILDGVPPRLRLAVYIRHGIMNVTRVRTADDAYAEACAILGKQLAVRGMC